MNPFGLGVRAYSAYNLRGIDLRISGSEHLPKRGPALIAARHYHHLYDGSALVHGLPRQPHVVVALDWTRSHLARLAMETLCNLCEWPIVLRTDNLPSNDTGVFARAEARRYLRTAAARTRDLLARGEIVAVFPEGYPTIDPAGSPKTSDDAFLPFRGGVVHFALAAARASGRAVPIVPAGFAYTPLAQGRYTVALRLGVPLLIGGSRGEDSVDALVGELARSVRELSHA